MSCKFLCVRIWHIVRSSAEEVHKVGRRSHCLANYFHLFVECMYIKSILGVNRIVVFPNFFNLFTNGVVLDLDCLDSKFGCEILLLMLIFVARYCIGGYLCTCDGHEHGFLVFVLHMVPRVNSIIVHRHIAVHIVYQIHEFGYVYEVLVHPFGHGIA